MLDLDRFLERVDLDGSDTSIATVHRATVRSIPYEDLDVQLHREIRLDVPDLVAKLVDRRRGGYCFELNTLFAAVLEALGHDVVRCLGRVRVTDAGSPRPATHLVLLVDGQAIDVGFGGATPLGPVPLGGEVTYGPWTWRTERARSPEGEDVWAMRFGDQLLYTFTEDPRHPVDVVTPNHYTSTHPGTIFANLVMVQRWDHDDAQIGLVERTLTVRRPGLPDEVTRFDPADLGPVLAERFGLVLTDDELAGVSARIVERQATGSIWSSS